MSKFDETKERLERSYDPERDLFDGPIQMNYIDKRLLDLITLLREEMISFLGIPKEFLDDQHSVTTLFVSSNPAIHCRMAYL